MHEAIDLLLFLLHQVVKVLPHVKHERTYVSCSLGIDVYGLVLEVVGIGELLQQLIAPFGKDP